MLTRMAPHPTRILVVDDEPMILNFLRTGLRYEGFEVAEASSGDQALDLARTFKPDLVVLDIMLPGLDGYEVCRRLRGDPELGILMLTARDEVRDRIVGLDLGADDYLVKPFDFDELLSRMRAILRRLRPPQSETLVVGDLSLSEGRHQVTLEGRPLELTLREFELLKLFLQHPRQALTRQTILDRVWGSNFFGAENNVEVYVGYLRSKLGERGRSLIQTVRGIGYRLVP
jgi:two-component system response regulator MprA